jgi:hypothetical protein
MVTANIVRSDYFLVVDGGREPIRLGPRLVGGGEADIHPVLGRAGCVAKIYHAQRPDASHASRPKLEAMLAKKPVHMTCRVNGEELPQFAWPTHIVEDAAGIFSGFVMQEVPLARSETLGIYMSRSSMRRKLSQDDCSLPRRVLVCANLASAITEMHRQEHYFVDIKPANISMFKDMGVLCLLDNDSFSIAGEECRFPASAYTSEYLAPELLSNEMSASTVITDWQDRFALAVLIFQILNNGLHPFQGVPQFVTDDWNIDMCVRNDYYPYGLVANAWVHPPPASVHTTWPVPLRELFDCAFAANQQPSKRPSAKEWRNLLQSFHNAFERCTEHPNNVLHIHFAGMPCQDCLFEQLVARHEANQLIQRAAGPILSEADVPDHHDSHERDQSPNSRPVVDVGPVERRPLVARADQATDASAGPSADASVVSGGGPAAPATARGKPRRGRKLAYGVAALVALMAAGLLLKQELAPYRSTVKHELPPASYSAEPIAAQAAEPTSPELASPSEQTSSAPHAQPPAPAPSALAPILPAEPSSAIGDSTLALARNVSGPDDKDGIEARIRIVVQAISAANRQNYADMTSIISDALAGVDPKTLTSAQTLMRNTDFTGAYTGWNNTRALGRAINDQVLKTYSTDLQGAIHAQLRALALAPLDREIAANLAYYLALDRRQAAMGAAVYALSLPRPSGATGTASAWQTVGVTLAHAGRMKDSEGAFDVGLVITSKLASFCLNLLTHQRDFGPELKQPVSAVFKRIDGRGQSGEENCSYPPKWME